MTLATAFSVGAMVVWIIAAHELWERPSGQVARERAVLYNVVTVLTLMLGVTTLYLALFAIVLLAGLFVIDGDPLRHSLRHPVARTECIVLAWFASSVAPIAGALGSSLEDDSVVREATYGFRQKQRMGTPRDEGSERREASLCTKLEAVLWKRRT